MIKGHGPLWGLCGDCLPYSGSHWAQPPRLSQGHLQRVAAQGLPRQGVLVPARPAASAHAAGRNGGKPRGQGVYHRLIGESAGGSSERQVGTGAAEPEGGRLQMHRQEKHWFQGPPPPGSIQADTQPAGARLLSWGHPLPAASPPRTI